MPISAALRSLTRTAVAAPPSSPQSIIPSILSTLQTLPTSDGAASGSLPDPTAPPPPTPPLDPFAPHLSSALVIGIICSPQCQQNPLSALHFFRWAASRFLPSPACYATVVDLLSHCCFVATEPLLDATAAAGCPGHYDFCR